MPLALPVLASVAGRKALAKPVALGVSDVWHAGLPLPPFRASEPTCMSTLPAPAFGMRNFRPGGVVGG